MSNLDLKIAEKLEYFQGRKDNLPDMKKRYDDLQIQFKTMDLKNDIRFYRKIQDEIEQLKKDIRDIQNGTSET